MAIGNVKTHRASPRRDLASERGDVHSMMSASAPAGEPVGDSASRLSDRNRRIALDRLIVRDYALVISCR